MLTSADYIYYTIYLFCLYASFKAGRTSIPGLVFLRIMLLAGLVTEGVIEVLQYLKKEENGPYYVYIPIEYFCLVQFYRHNTKVAPLRRAMNLSLPVYFLLATGLSFFYHRFSGYPSVLYNISCFLNTIWIALLLFNFEPEDGREIWFNPLFLICSGLLIFFAGVFFFNPVYPLIAKQDPALAKELRTYINIFLNYFLYILLSIGFLCSAKKVKSY